MRCVSAIDINVPLEVVWEITQNPERRNEWDYRVTESKKLSEGPFDKGTRCSVSGSFGFKYFLEYKYVLYEKCVKTAIKVTRCKGFPITGGGGGWTYEKVDEHSCRFHINFFLKLRKMPFEKSVDKYIVEPLFKWMSEKSLKQLKKIAEEEWALSNANQKDLIRV